MKGEVYRWRQLIHVSSGLKTYLRLKTWTWTRGSRIMPWFILLVSVHQTAAPAWAWPFTTRTVPRDWWPNWPRNQTMGRSWTFPAISGYGCCHIWRHNTLHTLYGLYHTLQTVLIEDISNSDCSALASKAASFDLANCISACATFTVASLSTGLLGEVWLRSGDAGLISAACLCLYSASISSIVGTIVWFSSAASIITLNTVARLAGWDAATDWVGDVTTFSKDDTAITLCTGDILCVCTVCGTMALSVTFLGVCFLWLVSLTWVLVATFALVESFTSWDNLFLWGGETDLPSVALCFPPLTGLLLLLGTNHVCPLYTLSHHSDTGFQPENFICTQQTKQLFIALFYLNSALERLL